MSFYVWIILVTVPVCFMAGCEQQAPHSGESVATTDRSGPVYVTPDQNLQHALDDAAAAQGDRTLILKPGVYRAASTSFCLLAITSNHDGVMIEGQEGAILSARSSDNPDVANVCHVIYCGDGVTSSTVIRSLTITGAKGLATDADVPLEDFGERAAVLKKGLFFYMDGGAVKIFGHSSPVFDGVDFVENETNLCGGAVSIEQQGFQEEPATFRNCRFLRNRCPGTGAAVDVLQGSAVRLENCLFVENIANYGMKEIKEQYQLSYNGEHGCGALTVFPESHAWVSRCTFVGNWNAVDDRSTTSRYEKTIFASNNASDGTRPGHPYELDIIHADGVNGCLFYSDHPDLQGTVSSVNNILNAEDPQLSENYTPKNPLYRDVGYHP